MEKVSKIKAISFRNEWQNPKGGSIYYHDIELDNGDKGQIGAKEIMPKKLQFGSELCYTIDGTKIKDVMQQKPFVGGGGGGTRSVEPFEHKVAGFSLSYAKDLAVAGKIEMSQIIPIADKFYDWFISKKQ